MRALGWEQDPLRYRDPTTTGRVNWRALLRPLLDGELDSKFFEGLGAIERSVIIEAASHRRFSEVSVAARERDRANQLFLLVTGSARFFFITPAGRQVYLLGLAPGDIFGAATLLAQPSTFLVSAEVAKSTHVLV